MREKLVLILLILAFVKLQAQPPSGFQRLELTSSLSRPWEITYGPDSMLWVTQSGGRVSRVDPLSGAVNTIFTASDYFNGDVSQSVTLPCNPSSTFGVSNGTYGMALHPDFFTTPYIYFIYSFNAGTPALPLSKFKVRRLTWNAVTKTVVDSADIITDLPLGLSHDGMRMLLVTHNNTSFLYISAGDGSIDDDRCYTPSTNANLNAQDWNSRFGKILRYNLDGSIPASNPIAGSPVFSSGHRNALGLTYNPATNKIYSSENGKTTDDEINIIEKGKNYGWPKARGYHDDNNYPGEAAFVNNYSPSFTGDELRQAMYSWCSSAVTLPEDPQSVSTSCVVAPSDLIYYPQNGLPDFRNSLLVTTLKNYNPNFRACVYVIKLNANGTGLDSASVNPKIYFEEQNPAILRYRDITTTPDGKTFFICTDSWDGIGNKILKYTFAPPTYKFTGNGNWSVAANWANNLLPPTLLPEYCEIIIEPLSVCVLDVTLTLPAGAKLTVKQGKQFIANNNIVVQ